MCCLHVYMQIPQLTTSLLVASEMAVDVRIRLGGHPVGLLSIVCFVSIPVHIYMWSLFIDIGDDTD